MKVVTAVEMRRIEQEAIASGCHEELFMERAGAHIALAVKSYCEEHHRSKNVILLCGKGNNAGDTYVAGHHLHEMGYAVTAYQHAAKEECSPLCIRMMERFSATGRSLNFVKAGTDIPFKEAGVILDGLFGTGFSGSVSGLYFDTITMANLSKTPIIAVDIPSGVDGTTGIVMGAAIVAAHTVALGAAKTGYFLGSGWDHLGTFNVVDFGLPLTSLDKANSVFALLEKERVLSLLPPIVRTRDKYSRGHTVALCGSSSMPGAAVLSTLAAMRAGAGIVHLLHPTGMSAELGQLGPEIVRIPYGFHNPDLVVETLQRCSSALIGPGLGSSPEIGKIIQRVLSDVTVPLVIDADALNYVSGHVNSRIPPGSILTPHGGEMRRLLGILKRQTLSLNYIALCQEYAEKNQSIIVLKGAPTFILIPGQQPTVCPYGDPGMATAGSGDVLSGIIASLLGQGLPPSEAALLGSYLHGRSGELAALKYTSQSFLASDIIAQIASAFG